MKKIDCDIFRDLFPNYIKGEISDNTKEFVDNHLKECNTCKSIFEEMTNNEKEENIEREEINVLKKYNRQMFILKFIIVTLIIVIISSLAFVGIRYYKEYKNGLAVHQLLSKSYESTKHFEASNNFTFSIKSPNMNSKYYYNNRKAKLTKEYLKDYIKGSTLGYVIDDGKNTYGIDFYDEGYSIKSIGFSLYIPESTVKDNIFLSLNYELEELTKLKPMDLGNCIIEEIDYNNIPCYVIKRRDGNFVYECLYINKENNLLLKDEKFNYKGETTYLYEYTYSTDNVNDDDIKIKDISEYEIDSHYYDRAVDIINKFK